MKVFTLLKGIEGRRIGMFIVALTGSMVYGATDVPYNPGFTPEQAAQMAEQIRNSKSADILYPKGLTPPEKTRETVRIDGKSEGRRWGGLGSAPATAMERQLMHYPKAIQEDILDLMFKPKFGMALTHLKVEVGGDNNSTAAVEPSFAHTREEMANPNFHRGGNYWIMRKARDRNPGIELGALAWAQPYWVGNGTGRTDNASFFTRESAEYFVRFFEGARDEWGLKMQFFSAEQNERHPAGRRDWIINDLKPAFEKAGLGHVGFVIDNGGWPLRDEDNDPELLKNITALGRHYLENTTWNVSSPEAIASGKPLWNSEMWSRDGRSWPLAIFLAETITRGYVDSRATQFTTWPILAGGLPGSLYGTTGLMMANKPWSGYYEIYPTVWIVAHFNQFAPMGWQTVDSGCGSLFVEPPKCKSYPGEESKDDKKTDKARLYYMTMKSPDGKDYSIIVVNVSAFARTLDFELSNLPGKQLYTWRSTEQEQFVRTDKIKPNNGRFTLEVEPWSVMSLTTTRGQHKGVPKRSVPADSSMALPYEDNFDGYQIGSDARYQSCSAGYFEVFQAEGESKTLRQVVPAKGLTWSIPKDNYPCVAIGDIRWADYEVSSDVLLEGNGTVALWSRVARYRDHGMAGYYLRVDQVGQWEFGVANNRHGGNTFYTEKSLATGIVAFASGQWHGLKILADGNMLSAYIDGREVVSLKDGTYANGAVGYSTWADAIQKDHEDMKAGMVIGTQYGHGRFDNLRIIPVPGKLSREKWKATATSAHEGCEPEKAIDADPTTFWHSEYNDKGPLPQSLTVNLGRMHNLREVRVLQRQSGLYITRYALYLSEDGSRFEKVSEGDWADDGGVKMATFKPVKAQYIRIEALEATDKRNCNVTVADLQVIEDVEP